MSGEGGLSTTTPPPVEVLTRGMISLFSRFSPMADNGVALIPSQNGDTTKATEMTTQDDNSNGYKGFLAKLRKLATEQPMLVKQLSDFLNRVNDKPVFESYPIFEDEDIPGCHEEFAPEVRGFLEQMSRDLLRTSIWKGSSEDETIAMQEHLEKLVMSKVYDHVFSPTESHRDRDKQLHLKILRLRVMVDPVKHLDMVSSLDPKDTDFDIWEKAAEELGKISTVKSPRDKLVCVANCCKILVQFIKSQDQSPIPDVFIPCLIYTIILANPENLHSNVEYISAYRGQQFLRGEVGHYLLHFASAVSFLWRCDGKALSMTADEFENGMSRELIEVEGKEEYDQLSPNASTLGLELPFNREWFEERCRYEDVSMSDLKVSDVADLLQQYQLLIKACRQFMPTKDS